MATAHLYVRTLSLEGGGGGMWGKGGGGSRFRFFFSRKSGPIDKNLCSPHSPFFPWGPPEREHQGRASRLSLSLSPPSAHAPLPSGRPVPRAVRCESAPTMAALTDDLRVRTINEL